MYFESYPIPDPSPESTDALGPELFYAPPAQHTDAPSSEFFDQDFAGLDYDLPIVQFDNFSPTFYESDPIIFTPPALTYSTDSEVTSTYYSSDFSQSDYSIPSEVESRYSLDYEMQPMHDPLHSAVFSAIPPPHPAEAQFDFGKSDLNPNVGISPEDLSIAVQPPPTIVVPTPPLVQVTPASEAQMAPEQDRPFKCPHCRQTSDRSNNMKKHIQEKHDKLRPFKCDICDRRFSRKNDRDRHCQKPNIHRKKKRVSSISRHLLDSNHRTTINRDPRTSSACPGPVM